MAPLLTRRQFARVGLNTTAALYGAVAGLKVAKAANSLAPTSPPPGWLKTARIFALEQWWPPYWPHIEIDWDRALATMRRLNLDTLQADALCKWAFYQTDLVAKAPELAGRDILQESSDFCRKHGFRMIMYTLFGHATPISTQQSKKGGPYLFEPLIPWKGTDGTPRHIVNTPPQFRDKFTRWHFGGEPYVAHCVFAQEQWMLAQVGELADRYDYDAAWVDSSASAGGGWSNDAPLNVCCCAVCQAAHQAEFGLPLPRIDGIEDPRLLDLRRWVQRRLDGVMEKLRTRFTKNARVPLVGNVAGGAGEASFYPKYMRHFDGGLFEHSPDTIDLVRKLGESRQITATAIHYPDIYDPLPRRVTSGWELENKGLMILSFDGTPYLAQPGKYYYDDHNDGPAKRIFDFMAQAKPLLARQRPEPYAALVAPLFYAHDNAQYQRYARGWMRLMMDARISPTQLPNYLVDTIDARADLPVLLVPDVEALGDEALQGILRFAENGGGVYLSGNVGLYDADLRPRAPESLAASLDLKPWGGSPEQWKRRANFDGAFAVQNRRETYDVYSRVEDPGMGFPVPDAALVGPTELGDLTTGPSWKTCLWAVPTDTDEPLMPILSVKRVGHGRLVYAGSPFESQYMDRRDPALGAWMKALLLWLGGRPLPMEVEASRLLYVGSPRLDDGSRLVYLINNSNDVQPPRTDWWEMMKVWERPLPIGSVVLRVPGVVSADTLYGPKPERSSLRDGILTLEWSQFCDHAVVHLIPGAV